MATHVWHYPAQDRQPISLPEIHQIGDVARSVLVAGRLLFGGFFLFSGIEHFLKYAAMTSGAASKGVPFPEVAVALTGVLILVGGLSVLVGYRPRLGAAMIALFLIGVTPMMHNFWALQEPQRTMEMGHFLSNVALLGGACFVASVPEPWPASVKRVKSVVVGAVIALMSASVSPSLTAAQNLPERFTAFAVNFDAPRGQVGKVVQIGVTRWSASVATRITADPRHQSIVLENYSAQPVLLQSVKREKS